METNNQLIKVILESKVEASTATNLGVAFTPFYTQLLEWSEKAKTLIVTDESQTREMKMAREARLALKDIRVAADKKRKDLKEDSTRYGKAVQAVYNMIEGLIEPAEKHFYAQEKFVEIKEQKRKDALKKVREVELITYQEFVSPSTFNELGEYSEKEYATILAGCKTSLQNKIEEEAKAEKERLEKEKTEKEERDRIKLENEKLRKETEELKAKVSVMEKTSTPETFVSPLPSIEIKPTSDPRLFHCFLCGSELAESRLGLLECDNCFSTFLPSLDRLGNQCFTHIK